MSNQATIIISDSRTMPEVADAAIDLVVTSPPYWHIKDYGVPGQIGYGQSLHDYLKDLYRTWRECFRVLREGARLCINIGDQFARAAVYGRYKVIPLHAEFINQCEALGFDFLGAIIWQKKTTMNPSGGAVVMGSYPFPPNGIVELDYEFIQIFKKPGPSKKVSKEVKAASRLTKEEWKEYFAGHWYFGGVKQQGHEAMFPEELPRRLIKMFTFRGDTVLDPFVGSGTTVKAALDLDRNAVGYEINEDFLAASPKIGGGDCLPFYREIHLIKANKRIEELPQIDYTPAIRDAEPRPEGHCPQLSPEPLHKVTQIIDERTLGLDNGARVAFLGVRIDRKAETLDYLRTRILGKNVFIKDAQAGAADSRAGYIYLKNRIFINAHLIKSGLGSPDPAVDHKLQQKFIRLQEHRGEIQSNQT
ncbi:MAG: site-specific DNA-methyltransferase [Syntrophobacterales bacterium]|jgi:DNA modification methylase|nr:site-specific DNA-methyltransferase [Syntrophobacterales bacterium]